MKQLMFDFMYESPDWISPEALADCKAWCNPSQEYIEQLRKDLMEQESKDNNEL